MFLFIIGHLLKVCGTNYIGRVHTVQHNEPHSPQNEESTFPCESRYPSSNRISVQKLFSTEHLYLRNFPSNASEECQKQIKF